MSLRLQETSTNLKVAIAAVVLLILCFLGYVIFLQDGLKYRSDYKTLSRDFVCGQNSFLHIEGKGELAANLDLLQRKNFLTYTKDDVGTVYRDNWIHPDVSAFSGFEETNPEAFLQKCKNTEGKSPIEVYKVISAQRVKEIFRNVFDRFGL